MMGISKQRKGTVVPVSPRASKLGCMMMTDRATEVNISTFILRAALMATTTGRK